MTKSNQIQTELRALGDGAFQKLVEEYLYKKGYEHINPLGSVIGADKVRKGTPDAFVTLPNGNYVFFETTTQKDGTGAKFLSDLRKCLDEKKTGIAVSNIEEIIFCHTGLLTTKETQALIEECQKYKIKTNIFGIGPISYDLRWKYPIIARDHLGIEVDTGQIVSPDEFVVAYNRNALVAPLDTPFHFREHEVAEILDGLEQDNLIIVLGRAGVGKTRLALECCERFKKRHPDYTTWCVHDRYNQDLLNDLHAYFSADGHYLILVDDANRISRFEYFIKLLQDQRTDQQIKVIVTVRDYANERIFELARPYTKPTKVELHPFSEREIVKLVEDEYEIRNTHYQERIVDIVHGNPRLAIMAAQIARRENSLSSIRDVSSLYDEYYNSIKRDLESLDNKDLMRVAGIVTFFRAVPRLNEDLMESIKQAFDIPPERFWEAAQQLHDIEVLDMYEDEIVRIADQTLAVYLFYLSFFKRPLLNFSGLLDHFFPAYEARFIDALSPARQTFSTQVIDEVMRIPVSQAWKRMQDENDEGGLLLLVNMFWFLYPTDTLVYMQNCIASLKATSIPLSNLEFKVANYISSPSYLSVLRAFENADVQMFRMAVNLILDYLVKQPNQLPQVLYILMDKFGFNRKSYIREDIIQRTVIEVLCDRIQPEDEELIPRLFLAVAAHYLHTYVHSVETRDRYTANISNFHLSPIPELLEMRKRIWKQIIQLYSLPSLQVSILELIYNYYRPGYREPSLAFQEQDAVIVLPFIESTLDPAIYYHCLIAQNYLDVLEHHNIAFDKELRGKFEHEGLKLLYLFQEDRSELENLDFDIRKYRQLKLERFRKHFSKYTLDQYRQFFANCLEIQKRSDMSHQGFHFQPEITQVLCLLADRDPDLYIQVLGVYRDLGNPLHLNISYLMGKLIEVCGSQQAYKTVNVLDYPLRTQWLFAFYRALPDRDISVEQLHHLYTIYQNTKCEEMPISIDFLLKYCRVDDKVVVNVARIVFEKSRENPDCLNQLLPLFDPHTEVCKTLFEHFKSDFRLLEQIYLATPNNGDTRKDYYGYIFDRILDTDPNFILEYIDQRYQRTGWLSHLNEPQDFTFVWRREDYQLIMLRIIEHICELEEERIGIFWGEYIEAFFILRAGIEDAIVIKEKQVAFLRELIKHTPSNPDFVRIAFNIVKYFPPDERLSFVTLFLETNKNLEDFRELPLEPNVFDIGIPALLERVDYFESLVPLLNTIDLLPHRQYVEHCIDRLRDEIEQEKKQDFIESY